MLTDRIEALGIDDLGAMWLRPHHARFAYIFRAAAGVDWDEERSCLYTAKPIEWSYLDWTKHVLKVVALEYDTSLFVDEKSSWSNIDEDLRRAILDIFKAST